MSVEIVRFIPPEVRLEMAQRTIDERGIRPLARDLGVNPKSVYKYKKGSSHPGDDVMARLLAIFKRDSPELLDDYLEGLKDDFLESMEEPIDVEEVLEGVEGGSEGISEVPPETEGSGVDRGETGGAGVDREETEGTAEGRTVDRETTEGPQEGEVSDREARKEVGLGEVYETIGVSAPFERAKVDKIVASLEEEGELSLDGIADWTELSASAVEGYVEELESEGLVKRKGSGVYELSVRIEGD